jgi:hypothetical protein
VNVGAPADAEVWLRPVTVGVTVNVLVLEAREALPFWTVTLGVPANASSGVVTVAVITVEVVERTVVRAVEFQYTTDTPGTKFVPVTVSVKPAVPAGSVLTGPSDEIVGSLTVKLRLPEALATTPFWTVTLIGDPTVVASWLVSATLSWVALT